MLTGRSRGRLTQLAAIFLAVIVVVAAGVVVGQAPDLFGGDIVEEPTAEVSVEDQRSNGTSVTIEHLSLSDGGFIVLTDGAGEQVAQSSYIESGEHENVTIHQDAPPDEAVDEDDDDSTGFQLVGQLTATVHQDTTEDETFRYEETDGEEDRPYVADGYPVSDTATVTLADRDDGDLPGSFVVEDVDAPSNATTEETLNVMADVRNPNDHESQQHVEFRLDGTVTERQVLELGPEESRTVEFAVNTSGSDPGPATLGVFTTEDGDMVDIDLEFEGENDLSVLSGDEDELLVDAAVDSDGFVVVTEADGESGQDDGDGETTDDFETVLATSDALDPGEHENVTVPFDEIPAENETLTASLAVGDPDDLDDATVAEADGEPVTVEFALEDLATPDEADADDTDDEDGAGDD